MKIVYFTSTGHNLYIAESLGGELLSIPQLIKKQEYEIKDEVVGIIFPVYYASVPQIVKDYLSKVKIKTEYLFTITSHGFAKTGAIRALKVCNKIIEKNNQKFNYSNHVLMIDNFIPVFDMQKEMEIKDDNLIDEKILKIKMDIQNKKDLEVPKSIISDLIFTD